MYDVYRFNRFIVLEVIPMLFGKILIYIINIFLTHFLIRIVNIVTYGSVLLLNLNLFQCFIRKTKIFLNIVDIHLIYFRLG